VTGLQKLIIGIEESFDSNRKEDSEKIKNLSTAMTFKLEAKGQYRFEIEFFGKIILVYFFFIKG